MNQNKGRWSLPAIKVAATALIATMIVLSTGWPALAQDPSDQTPAKPTGLTGTLRHDRVSLTWDNPGDDTITGHQILRRDT